MVCVMRVRGGGGWGRETGGARKQWQRQGAEFTTQNQQKPRHTAVGKAGATSHHANRFATWEGCTNSMEGGRGQEALPRAARPTEGTKQG